MTGKDLQNHPVIENGAMTRNTNTTTGPRLRIVLAPGIAFGPGKAAVLEGVRDTGSIAATGRRMRMSYKRAWSLIEAMNRDFGTPLVATQKGGKSFGGATLTEAGESVLALYRSMEHRTSEAIEADLALLQKMLPEQGA
jgi:molybdate transport system regulatory protein